MTVSEQERLDDIIFWCAVRRTANLMDKLSIRVDRFHDHIYMKHFEAFQKLERQKHVATSI